MKINYLPFLLICISILGCRNEQHKIAKKTFVKHAAQARPSDTLIVDHKTALEVQLSNTELENRRKKIGDTAFYTGADDYVWYSYLADSTLKQKKLPVLSANGYKYIEFLQRNGEKRIIKVDTLSELITMYFFDPVRSPRAIDETDIEEEYKNYFQ